MDWKIESITGYPDAQPAGQSPGVDENGDPLPPVFSFSVGWQSTLVDGAARAVNYGTATVTADVGRWKPFAELVEPELVTLTKNSLGEAFLAANETALRNMLEAQKQPAPAPRQPPWAQPA